MSRLTRGRDTLQVWPEVAVTDARRNPVRVPSDDPPIEVRGLLQPVSSEESAAQGQQVSTLYRFMCRDFPGGPWARVVGADREWDVVGDPARYTGSRRSAHVTLLLRARTPLAVPNG